MLKHIWVKLSINYYRISFNKAKSSMGFINFAKLNIENTNFIKINY